MKLTMKDNKIVVFLNKKEIINLDFNNEEKLEDYFKSLFKKINNKYAIELNRYYDIDVYNDEYFGIILEIQDEELDYCNYFKQIDMKINVLKESSFLYEIEYGFIDEDILNKTICYKNNDKIYLKLEKDIDEITLAKILEYSNIIYGDVIHNIIKYGKKVKI